MSESRSLRRAKRYRYLRRKAFGAFTCAWHTWQLRRQMALRGFGPKQIRGKTKSEMLELIYGD